MASIKSADERRSAVVSVFDFEFLPPPSEVTSFFVLQAKMREEKSNMQIRFLNLSDMIIITNAQIITVAGVKNVVSDHRVADFRIFNNCMTLNN